MTETKPLDLFGLAAGPMLTKKQRKSIYNRAMSQPKGYAALPGMNSPAADRGETCGTCQHIMRTRRYRKCRLVRGRWTHGPGTDIKARSRPVADGNNPKRRRHHEYRRGNPGDQGRQARET